MHRAQIQIMRLGTRLECVGSSPRVSGVCQDGAREFAGRRSRLVRRLSGVADRLAGSWEGLEVDVFGRCDESSPGVRQDFIEGIGKIARNMLGDRQRKTMRLTVGDSGGCRIARVRS
ncbi:hypothetical protein BHE74_00038313 [Ensete ventricosum]|nr:hypothetical protein BHE74_00038313 [Ensete ventricosum]